MVITQRGERRRFCCFMLGPTLQSIVLHNSFLTHKVWERQVSKLGHLKDVPWTLQQKHRKQSPPSTCQEGHQEYKGKWPIYIAECFEQQDWRTARAIAQVLQIWWRRSFVSRCILGLIFSTWGKRRDLRAFFTTIRVYLNIHSTSDHLSSMRSSSAFGSLKQHW